MARQLAPLSLAALLAGCATPPAVPDAPAESGLARFSGRLSVQSLNPYSGRAQGGNAGFELRGGPSAGELTLSTPLGTLLGRARWRAGEVGLSTPEGERRYESLDALSADLLGEPIPVAALFAWLQGRPWAGHEFQPDPAPHEAAGQPLGFTQLGWHIDPSRIADGLIQARRLQEPVVTLRVRLEP